MSKKYMEVAPELRLAGRIINAVSISRTKEQFLKRNQPKAGYKQGCPKGTNNMRIEEKYIPTRDGRQERILVYEPVNKKPMATGLFWIHGGGYIGGNPDSEKMNAQGFIEASNTVVVSPQYTLSCEKPYPAALNDCYDALVWMNDHTEELGINPSQIFIGGGSAGGGLTLATALYARDHNEVRLAFMMPIYPMINDRMDTPSAIGNTSFLWNSQCNKWAWETYLGELFGEDNVPIYASPARERDYHGLPPTYTYVGTLDPFYDDTLLMVEKLKKAGIPVKYDVYQGAYHGFDALCSWTGYGKRALNRRKKAYLYAVEHFFTE